MSLRKYNVTIVIVTTNYVKPSYAMTYLEALQKSGKEPQRKSKTTKAPPQTYAADLNS